MQVVTQQRINEALALAEDFTDVLREAKRQAYLERVGVAGVVNAMLFSEEGDLLSQGLVANVVTQVGNQYYAERAAGIASPPNQVTGMRLGTGTTAAATTGAGAAIVTYISASQVAIDGGFPTSGAGGGTSRRITWQSTWAAGVATNATINEVVITNETPLTNVAGTAANTIARAVLTTVNKASGDTSVVSWTYDLGT